MKYINKLLLLSIFFAHTALGQAVPDELPAVNGPVEAFRVRQLRLSPKSGGGMEEAIVEVYRYDSKNCLIEREVLKNDGTNIGRVTYKYDGQKKPSEIVYHDSDGRPVSKDIYYYQSDGRILKFIHEDKGSPIYKDIYRWNAAGDMVEVSRLYSPDERLQRRAVMRYSKGEISDISFYDPNGSLSYKEVYTYDSSGNLVEQVSSDSENSVSRVKYTYEHDSNGNWVKQTEWRFDSKGFVPSVVLVRDITYR